MCDQTFYLSNMAPQDQVQCGLECGLEPQLAKSEIYSSMGTRHPAMPADILLAGVIVGHLVGEEQETRTCTVGGLKLQRQWAGRIQAEYQMVPAGHGGGWERHGR